MMFTDYRRPGTLRSGGDLPPERPQVELDQTVERGLIRLPARRRRVRGITAAQILVTLLIVNHNLRKSHRAS